MKLKVLGLICRVPLKANPGFKINGWVGMNFAFFGV
jgi:hypothetical protein